MNVYFVYKVLTNRIQALIIAAGYINPLSVASYGEFPVISFALPTLDQGQGQGESRGE